MERFYRHKKSLFFLLALLFTLKVEGQGNRLSIQSTPPKLLSICGTNDSASVEIYNISSGTVSNITVKLTLAPGILYVPNSLSGLGMTEKNIANLNQPVFNVPNLGIAKNIRFRVMLSADCNLLSYINNNNSPVIAIRADYTGNFDLGISVPFSVRVPSVQFGTITNLSFTGDIGSKFGRSITIGNYGKGPLKEIKLTRINGKDISTYFVSKGTTVFKGDTVITTFGTTFFKTIGNLDTFLDQNESVTLVDSTVIKGCKNLNTNMELSWGCNLKSCQVAKTSGSAIISNNSPVLKALAFPVTPTCFNNKTFKSELRFVNTGNMPATQVRVAISLNYPYMTSTFDTNSVRIRVGSKTKWTRASFDSTTATYNLGYYGCIGLYPIGFFRMKIPDLKPNDTFFVTWDTRTCVPPPCTNGSYVVNSWAYHAEYRDQCKNLKIIPWAWGKVYDYHSFASSSFIPTDLINNQIGEYRLLISSANFLPRTSNARYVVDLILPKGLIHSKLKKDLYFINADLNGKWSPDSIISKGDTLRGFFPHPVPISMVNSELVFYLKADCSKAGSNGVNNIGLQIRYNPDKNCNPQEWHYFTCQTLQTKIHCISNCNGGMRFRNFSVQRINFGKPDNNNDGIADASGSLDTLNIREERCFVGDTIMAEYTGVIKRSATIITWRNAYIESIVTNGNNLEVAGVQLLVYRRGVTLSVNCSQVKSWKTVSGANATFKVDLSTDSMLSCVSSGFRYSNDDSLIVRVKFRVSKNIGGAVANVFFNNRFYTSNVNNPTSSSNKFQCDTFSGQMIMAGYYFTSCCSDVCQVNSCNQLAVNNYFYLGIGACCSNYGGNNYFPYEYRNFAKLKTIKLNMPQGFRYKSGIMAQYRTSGSNKTTYETKDSVRPVNINSTPLLFDVSRYYKDSAKGTINLSDDGFHGYFVAYIEPSCEIQGTAGQPLKYDFIFERRNTLGTGYDTISNVGNDQVVYNKPVTAIRALSPTIYAAKDTAEWELIYTNYSSTFSNINTWFAPDNSGAIKIVQIKDMTADTFLPSANGIFRAGTMPYNNTRKFRIRAIYNSCNKDSVILYSGWNCQSYPTDISGYNCSKERIALYLEPQNTQYQATLSDSVVTADLCASVPYTFTLENIGATTGYNTKAILNLPVGMTVVTGSCSMQYPHKSSSVSIPSPVLKSGTAYEWDLSTISSALSAGFKGVSDTAKNKIIIRFRVKTDCDYSSGNYIRASASGNIKCGNPVIAYPAISNPLNIKGVTRPYYTLLKVTSDSIFPCEKSTKVKVKIINLGPGKTGTEDKYQAFLLQGMNYDSALFLGINNAPDNTLTKTKNINGATEVEFSLTGNISPGDSMEFNFGFNSDGKYLPCGAADLYSQSAVKQEVICIADSSKCRINVVTGNSFINPKVVKGDIRFTNLKASIQQTSYDSETLNLAYRVFNAGNSITSDKPLIYKVVYDANGSGTVDKNDVVTGVDTLWLNLAKNGYVDISKTLDVKPGYSCALFLTLDSSSCSCVFNTAKFPVPALKNAGTSAEVCSGAKLNIGKPAVNTFKYLWWPGADFNSDTLAQPDVTVQNAGTGFITKQYVLTTYRGMCTSKDTVKINVFSLPELNLIQKDTTVCEGKNVLLKAASTNGTAPHSIRWQPAMLVGDSTKFITGSTALSTQVFKATVTDSKGCTDTDSMTVKVNPVPEARFGFPETCQGNVLQIRDSSTIANDSIVFRKWYFFQTDTLGVNVWDFDMAGLLQSSVKLEVKSSGGCTDSIRRTVHLNPLPKAAFTTFDVCAGDSLSAVNISVVSTGQIQEMSWNTGDGTSYVSKDLRHLYATADTFDVLLSVGTDKNCYDTSVRTVIIHPKPDANFTVSDKCLGDSLNCLNSSAISGDSIIRYEWTCASFASGEYSPAFLLLKDTAYAIHLMVASDFGCRDTAVKTAYIHPNPKAAFNVKNVCELEASKITDQSSLSKGTISAWEYQLSDGNAYNLKDFAHTFNTGDTFDIRQTITSDKTCSDTFLGRTIVYPKLTADFNPYDICVSDSIRLIDKTTFINTGISAWKWKVSPSDSSFLQNLTYKFSKWGVYTVSLKVTSMEGCVYDTQKTIVVYPLPLVDFSDTNKCVDNAFDFSSVLSIPSGTISKVYWNFGDQFSSTDPNPSHSFPAAGNYPVKLIAESDFGCKDSTEHLISSYPPVKVDFAWKDVCLGDVMLFKDLCYVPNSSIKTYNWDFDDGTSGAIKDPSHIYKTDGSYNVKLKIITGYNCSYDSSHTVLVHPVPKALFSTDPEEATIVDPTIVISDLSSGADSVWYDLGDGTMSSVRNLVKSYPDSGVFYIRQTTMNKHLCVDSFIKKIRIKYLFVFNAPTAFSPNEDGINDLYAPGGIGIVNYSMNIFNRWGELIFQTDKGEPWDGTYQGEPVMEGVYAVTFKVKDFKGIWHYKKASFVLIR